MKLKNLITAKDILDAGFGRTKFMPLDMSDEQMIAYAEENIEQFSAVRSLAKINVLGDEGLAMFLTFYQLIDSAIQHAAERRERTGDATDGKAR